LVNNQWFIGSVSRFFIDVIQLASWSIAVVVTGKSEQTGEELRPVTVAPTATKGRSVVMMGGDNWFVDWRDERPVQRPASAAIDCCSWTGATKD